MGAKACFGLSVAPHGELSSSGWMAPLLLLCLLIACEGPTYLAEDVPYARPDYPQLCMPCETGQAAHCGDGICVVVGDSSFCTLACEGDDDCPGGSHCSLSLDGEGYCADADGECIAPCSSGWGDCDLDPANGCETLLNTESNCGGCGHDCSLVFHDVHADGECNLGHCVIADCKVPWKDCDGLATNGCETNTTEPGHCGGCAVSCFAQFPHANAACDSGKCVLGSCHQGWGDCDGAAFNGCETKLDSLWNCGACGHDCSTSFPQAVGLCVAGQCVISECEPACADCDQNPNNGCEAALGTLENCAACGNNCADAYPHAIGECSDGLCVSVGCQPGWGDCDGLSNNGCEVQLGTETHCSGCGQSCTVLPHGDGQCSDGVCVPSQCDWGWGDCDGKGSNGCEKSLHTESDCGQCGQKCELTNAVPDCQEGQCVVVSCESDYGDCDGKGYNGCEMLLGVANCGTCGNNCLELPNVDKAECENGKCLITACLLNWADCNDLADDGCETHLPTSNQHCGKCDVPCGTGEQCSGGFCA